MLRYTYNTQEMTMIIVAQNKQIVFSQFPVSILFIKKICQVIFRDYMFTYLFQVIAIYFELADRLEKATD